MELNDVNTMSRPQREFRPMHPFAYIFTTMLLSYWVYAITNLGPYFRRIPEYLPSTGAYEDVVVAIVGIVFVGSSSLIFSIAWILIEEVLKIRSRKSHQYIKREWELVGTTLPTWLTLIEMLVIISSIGYILVILRTNVLVYLGLSTTEWITNRPILSWITTVILTYACMNVWFLIHSFIHRYLQKLNYKNMESMTDEELLELSGMKDKLNGLISQLKDVLEEPVEPKEVTPTSKESPQ